MNLLDNVIDAILVVGPHVGQSIMIPVVPVVSSDEQIPSGKQVEASFGMQT